MDVKTYFSKTYVQALLTIIFVGVILALASYAYLTLKQAKGAYTGETTISVRGEGEVLAKPDLGEFSFSVLAEGDTAAQAQEGSAEAMNTILAYLTEAGVDEKDIKTQYYNLNPKYTYQERVCPVGGYCPPGDRVLDGYEVSQSISVKVRDLDTSGDLISGVGERGATNISSLQFTIDDESELKAEAREKAIADAKEKAKELADDLGVKLVKMVGFYEDEGMYYPMMESRAYGMGGDMAMEDGMAPKMPTGENTVMSSVTIMYEIR